jgi:hypothetical protein
MRSENFHLCDEELLLHSSGELSSTPETQVRTHLECCSKCQNRLSELEDSLDEFSEAHGTLRNKALPSADRARSSLQARLAELTAENERNRWRAGWLRPLGYGQAAAMAGVALVACFALAMWLRRPSDERLAFSASIGHQEEPDMQLTPGATIPVTENEICGTDEAEPVIPVSLRQKVFELYKVTQPRDEYEVDYLITPELGGATDIRNLWPEPYQNAVWNAHVKDQLEDRLHHMVCHGEVDLATAQKDISTDWIAAYRKYFHTDLPIADGTTRNLSYRKELLPST